MFQVKKAMQDPHPGTTWNYKTGGIIHQLDRAARTCWLGCPGLLHSSGGLRRKLSFSPVPLHGRFLQDPTSPVQRSSEVQNPAPSASFPREQSVVSSYQK
ncbi:hypothetical protein TNCV_222391 [Trichonephila clavipes]|nr:hypothetical protein TNCV_222391 [Trichonephila clavipes]